MTKLAVALGFLALNFYTYHYMAHGEVEPPRRSFSEFPLEFGEWWCPERERMDPRVENALDVTDYLICTYRKRSPLDVVGVYVGFNRSQVREQGGANSTQIHPPKHCLPGSGWDIIESDLVPLEVDGLPERPATVNRLMIAKGSSRQLVYYWYQERGRVIGEDWKKILYQFWDRATRNRTDGSLVRFSIPVVRGDTALAEENFEAVARLVIPKLPEYVPN